LVNGDAAIPKERILSVVKFRTAVTVGVIGNLMVVPNRNPGELLVACKKIQISTVSCNPLAVVIEGVDFTVRKRNAVDAVAPAVISVLVLVNVVAEMNNIVNGVLSFQINPTGVQRQ
jgi:hypothetical protein